MQLGAKKRAVLLSLCFFSIPLSAPSRASGAPVVQAQRGASVENASTPSRVGRRPSPDVLDLVTLSVAMTSLVEAAGTQNQCLAYSYDPNGNRIAENQRSFDATPTWGSSTFGCFNGTSP